MVPIQTVEELLSVSYVSAVVARSGFLPSAVSHDFGVDLSVRKIGSFGSKRIDLGAFLDLQLKASVNWTLGEHELAFDLEADAYNRLVIRKSESSTPCALVVCCLPRDQSCWLDVCEDELVLKKCCYYHFITGGETKNVRSRRLRIPRTKLLTPQALIDLANSIRAGGPL